MKTNLLNDEHNRRDFLSRPDWRERMEDIPLLINELISRMEHEKRGSIRFNSAAITACSSGMTL